MINVVTGSSGFTGKYITRRLLAMSESVRSLSGHPERPHEFGDRITVAPFSFDDPNALRQSLAGADTLFNTYWVRFPHGRVTHDRAVENSKALIEAAKDAGVRRVVHVSIANPSEDSDLKYYSGKALVEKAIRESGLSYAIARPTVLFGPEDILINNIAYFLRKYPFFVVPGSGKYGMQPIFVDDFAEILVEAAQTDENLIFDAVGPEVFTFEEIVRLLKRAVGSHARIFHVNPALALKAVQTLGSAVGDVVLTGEEIEGLMRGLLVSNEPPRGHIRLSEWLAQNAASVGNKYHSELARHYR